MDLEPCLNVYNLVVIQLKNTKLGQMTNLKVVFHMVVLFYKFAKLSNSNQSPAQFQSGLMLDDVRSVPDLYFPFRAKENWGPG